MTFAAAPLRALAMVGAALLLSACSSLPFFSHKDDDPEAKQAFETLLKRLPEDQRERATASIAKHVFRLTNPREENSKTQSAGMGRRM